MNCGNCLMERVEIQPLRKDGTCPVCHPRIKTPLVFQYGHDYGRIRRARKSGQCESGQCKNVIEAGEYYAECELRPMGNPFAAARWCMSCAPEEARRALYLAPTAPPSPVAGHPSPLPQSGSERVQGSQKENGRPTGGKP